MSKWDRPTFILGCWGLGALLAVGLGHWQGYAALNKPQVAVESADSRRSHETTAESEDDGRSLTTSATNPTTGWHSWPADAPAPAIAPFDAAQAKKHQEEWAAYLKLPVEYTNSLGMRFVLIPPGEFIMGSSPQEIEAALKDVGEDKHWQECIKSEAPQHKVVLTQAIYLGVNEVTQKEYEAVMQATPSHFASTGPGKEAVANLDPQNHPVEMVSWNDAAEFCAKLSQKDELKPFYFRAGETITPLEGTGYRLPTEAEWEFACRAGTTTKYWIGDQYDQLVRAGWSGGNSGGRTHAAGELKANPLGLYDMPGNVWEWVEDAWDPLSYGQFAEQPATNPNSPSFAGSQRVLRGGDWHDPASSYRSASRYAHDPAVRGYSIGFRVSLVADAVKESLKRPGVAADPPLATEAEWTSLMPGENKEAWSTLGPFQAKDGLLVASGGGANAISKAEYDDFELEAEWRVLAAGNSGIYYREPPNSDITAGNEYQLLDDAAYADKQPPNMLTGSLYGVIAPTRPASKPLGEWNLTRIVCRGPVVEHWLNGEQVVRYDTSSAAWRDSLASSSFKNKAAVGLRPRGHILLQAHTGEVAFRSLRIRALAPKMTATPANSEG